MDPALLFTSHRSPLNQIRSQFKLCKLFLLLLIPFILVENNFVHPLASNPGPAVAHVGQTFGKHLTLTLADGQMPGCPGKTRLLALRPCQENKSEYNAWQSRRKGVNQARQLGDCQEGCRAVGHPGMNIVGCGTSRDEHNGL